MSPSSSSSASDAWVVDDAWVERIEQEAREARARPKKPLSPRAQEILRKFDERTEQWRRENDERAEARAKEAGYSSWQENEAQKMKEWAARDVARQKSLAEDCARRGITVEQYWEQDPQMMKMWPRRVKRCDCVEHKLGLGFFCPQRLVDYRSMDVPDLMGYLECRHRLQPDEMRIGADERSRRLTEAELDRYCDGAPESPGVGELPFWARADPTMLRLAGAVVGEGATAGRDPGVGLRSGLWPCLSPSPIPHTVARAQALAALCELAPRPPSPSWFLSALSSSPPALPPLPPLRAPVRPSGRVGKFPGRRGQRWRASAAATTRRVTRSSRTTALYELDGSGRATAVLRRTANNTGSRGRRGR